MKITQAVSIDYDERTDTRNPIGPATRNRWTLKQIAQHGKIIGDTLVGWAPYTHLVYVDHNLVDGVSDYYHVVATL